MDLTLQFLPSCPPRTPRSRVYGGVLNLEQWTHLQPASCPGQKSHVYFHAAEVFPTAQGHCSASLSHSARRSRPLLKPMINPRSRIQSLLRAPSQRKGPSYSDRVYVIRTSPFSRRRPSEVSLMACKVNLAQEGFHFATPLCG